MKVENRKELILALIYILIALLFFIDCFYLSNENSIVLFSFSSMIGLIYLINSFVNKKLYLDIRSSSKSYKVIEGIRLLLMLIFFSGTIYYIKTKNINVSNYFFITLGGVLILDIYVLADIKLRFKDRR